MLAALLAAIAFLVAAALFPLQLLGPASGVFPAGNPVGGVGDALRNLLVAGLGLGSAAVPLGLLAGAATTGGWWLARVRRALWVLAASLVLVLPVATSLAGGDGPFTGLVGDALGGALRGGIGWLGAWVVVAAAVVATSVAAFRFDPLRPVAALAGRLGRGGARGLRRAAKGARARAAEHRERVRAEREAAREAREEERAAAAAAGPSAPPPEGGEGVDGTGRDAAAGSGDDRASTGAEASAAEAGDPTRSGGGRHARRGRPEAPAGEADDPMRAEAAPATTEPAPDGPSPPSPTDAGGEDAAPPPPPPPDHPCPPLELLTGPRLANRYGMERELDRLAGVLLNTLRTFNIECEIAGRTTGPAVTQYEVVPAAGVKVNRIANLDADLALAMRARSVRIVAPIPGKGAVGVEIPNPRPEIVRLREILETAAFVQSRGALPLAMGKDLAGLPYVADLARMPHALIAGATGSGKSVCLNTIITSLVYRHGPERLRLLLIDPKMVELSAYADLPHLRHPVVTDPREAAGALKWACMEMERRYTLLSANGVRSLQEFNDRLARGVELRLPGPEAPDGDPDDGKYTDGPLPWIVVVVDELADLMMTVQAEVERPLAQLAQKARAIGIHLLVATQRPSVNVVTGLIKANFPCRIAFRVASKTDSRTILDQNGADSLLGHGDMLFLPPGQSEPVRMQGAFVSTDETEKLMGWFREEADTLEALKARVAAGEQDILQELREMEDGDGDEEFCSTDWDDLFREAAGACISQGSGSTSLLQRRLRIGYGRAARIVDQLHDAGVLGPPDGSRPREVLVDLDGLDEICPA